jgi:hypothetical protein
MLLHWCLCVQLSRALRDHARTIAGKSQLFINAFAKALEVRPGLRETCVHVCIQGFRGAAMSPGLLVTAMHPARRSYVCM